MATDDRIDESSGAEADNGFEQQQQQQQRQRHHDEDAKASLQTDVDESDGISLPENYAENFVGHLPLHWLQPKGHPENNSNSSNTKTSILPSFRDLRLKTHQTLYGTTNATAVPRQLPRDKSPKGSVDAPIRHLVDLINSHSRYCTLSSCSGRLSLFDPTGRSGNIANNIDGETTDAHQFTEASGKGRGSWVLVSHDRVQPQALVEALDTAPQIPYYSHNKRGNSDLNDVAEDAEDPVSEGNSIDDDDESDDERDCEENTTGLLQPWTFRFEPLLLHIAAASLEDGRRLLTIALNAGFRESGLVVTDKRVTVAIRSHSLSTATPLIPAASTAATGPSSHSSLCVPPSYLRALVHDANQRLEANWKHLDKLYRSIESTLFEVRSSPPPLVVRDCRSSGIPALNLWKAASVGPAIPSAGIVSPNRNPPATRSSETTKPQDIFIVGGYGCGPSVSGKQASAAKRSSSVYRLQRKSPSDNWDEGGWQKLVHPSGGATEADPDPSLLEISNREKRMGRVPRVRVRWCTDSGNNGFPDLQAMESCRWTESLVLFWGGRTSPTRPAASETLYVLDTGSDARIGTIEDVRGDLPPPRWGHQLVAIRGDRMVLLGGCNQDDGALDDVFVLHFRMERTERSGGDNDSAFAQGYFYWERLSIRMPSPRFHFGAVPLDGDTILVIGGLESTRHLLQPFEPDAGLSSPSSAIWAFRVGKSKRRSEQHSTVPRTPAAMFRVEISEPSSMASFRSFFGMACCTLLSNNLLLVTGGIQQNRTKGSDPLQAFWISRKGSSTLRVQRIELGYDRGSVEDGCFDFGALVHHCCIPVADNELILVGGGVPSFAFGECYAR